MIGPQHIYAGDHYSGGVHPGRVVGDNCNIGYAGRELTLQPFEILVSQ